MFCRDCKFWDRENKESEADEEYKFCLLQQLSKARFYLACQEHTLFTGPNFGCVQFEEIGSDNSNA